MNLKNKKRFYFYNNMLIIIFPLIFFIISYINIYNTKNNKIYFYNFIFNVIIFKLIKGLQFLFF